MRYVVGIAGAAGAGKTSLVQRLVCTMPDACAVHMDNYQEITRQPIGRLMEWMARGADFDEFSLPLLVEHLERLKRGETVVDPAGGHQVVPGKYIVLETHFGRVHRATGRYIDLLLWIDAPSDVTLARNVRDFLEPMRGAPTAEEARQRAGWIDTYLRNYLSDVRHLVQAQRKAVSADADLSLDGSTAPDEIAQQARRLILERLP